MNPAPLHSQAGHREVMGLGHQVMRQQWLEHITKDTGEMGERGTQGHMVSVGPLNDLVLPEVPQS